MIHLSARSGMGTESDQIERKKVIRVRPFIPLGKQYPEYAEARGRSPEEGHRWLAEHELTFPKPGDSDWTPPLPLTEDGVQVGSLIMDGVISLEEGMRRAALLQVGADGGLGGQAPSSG
jgi:hypothetical protein